MGFVQAKEDTERAEEGKGTTGGSQLNIPDLLKKKIIIERLRSRKEGEETEQGKGVYKF